MGLPPEYRTPHMDELSRTLASMGPQDLSKFPPLTREDQWMIGTYIQNYNFMGLNLRRALEIFEQANRE